MLAAAPAPDGSQGWRNCPPSPFCRAGAEIANSTFHGTHTGYDYEDKQNKESTYHRRARELIHEDCFLHVSRVDMGPGVGDLEYLIRLVEMQKKLGSSAVRCEFNDDAVDHLLALSELKHLSLWNTPISDVDLEQLVSLTELESLNLSETKITDSGLRHLRALRKLRRLDLSGTAVTDTGLESLRTLPRLEMLDLIKTKITDEGLESLQDFKQLQTVKLVEEISSCVGSALTPTLVTEEAIEKLQSQRPRLQIEYTKPRTWNSIPVP